jgi:hypothetical protein
MGHFNIGHNHGHPVKPVVKEEVKPAQVQIKAPVVEVKKEPVKIIVPVKKQEPSIFKKEIVKPVQVKKNTKTNNKKGNKK